MKLFRMLANIFKQHGQRNNKFPARARKEIASSRLPGPRILGRSSSHVPTIPTGTSMPFVKSPAKEKLEESQSGES